MLDSFFEAIRLKLYPNLINNKRYERKIIDNQLYYDFIILAGFLYRMQQR